MPSAVRPRVFLDIQIGTEPAGRIVIELFNDHTPKTCENFRALCTGEKGQPLHYQSSIFHRVIDEFMLQGGDVTRGDGRGGKSIYGETFEDENLNWRKMDAEGLVCMANRGPNTNSSQFFITLAPCEHLNGKHTIFGHVVSGLPLVQKIGTMRTNSQDKPLTDVIISHSGELEFKRAAPKNNGVKSSTSSKRRRSRSGSENRSRSRSRHRGRDKDKEKEKEKDRSRSRERRRAKHRDHREHREHREGGRRHHRHGDSDKAQEKDGDRDRDEKSHRSRHHGGGGEGRRERKHHRRHHSRSRSRSKGSPDHSHQAQDGHPSVEKVDSLNAESDVRGRTPKTRGRSITPQPLHTAELSPKDRQRGVSPSRSHSPDETPKKERSPRRRRSRSTTPSRHRDRRDYRSRSRTRSPPDRSGYRDSRSRRGYYDDEEERRIEREEMERESGRLGYAGGAHFDEPEGGIKFKGRGSMKFREKKRARGGYW